MSGRTIQSAKRRYARWSLIDDSDEVEDSKRRVILIDLEAQKRIKDNNTFAPPLGGQPYICLYNVNATVLSIRDNEMIIRYDTIRDVLVVIVFRAAQLHFSPVLSQHKWAMATATSARAPPLQ